MVLQSNYDCKQKDDCVYKYVCKTSLDQSVQMAILSKFPQKMPRSKNFDPQVVLRKALNLFWTQGYHATSMRDLINDLEINRASLYDTYGSKLELFDSSLNLYSQDQLRWWSETLYYETVVRQGIYKLLEYQYNLKTSKGDRATCFIVRSLSELYTLQESSSRIIDKHIKQQEEMLTNYLQYGINQGQISPFKDVGLLSKLMMNIIHGVSIAVVHNQEDYLARQSAAIISLLD